MQGFPEVTIPVHATFDIHVREQARRFGISLSQVVESYLGSGVFLATEGSGMVTARNGMREIPVNLFGFRYKDLVPTDPDYVIRLSHIYDGLPMSDALRCSSLTIGIISLVARSKKYRLEELCGEFLRIGQDLARVELNPDTSLWVVGRDHGEPIRYHPFSPDPFAGSQT